MSTFRPLPPKDLLAMEPEALAAYLNGLTPSQSYLECMRLVWATEPWRDMEMGDWNWSVVMQGYDNLAALEGADHE